MSGSGTKCGGKCGGWEAPCSNPATREVDGIWFCDSCADGASRALHQDQALGKEEAVEMESPGKCNLLTAMENIRIGEELAVAVTFVMAQDDVANGGSGVLQAIGRVFNAGGVEIYRTQEDARDSYRDATLKVLADIQHQWATNHNL